MIGLVGIAAALYSSHLRVYAPGEIAGVATFGRIRVGGEAVAGRGSFTFAPYYKIPPAKFYVTVVKKGLWCSRAPAPPPPTAQDTPAPWGTARNNGQ